MDSRPYRAFVAFFASALLVLAGLLASGILPLGAPINPVGTVPVSAEATGNFDQLVVVLMENKNLNEVYGPAPYMTQLADQYSFSQGWSSITNPSQPNYIAIMGASTFGVGGDGNHPNLNHPTLVDLIETSGHTWNAIAEGSGSGCSINPDRGEDHFPFLSYTTITGNAARCANLHSGGAADVVTALNAGTNFIWFTPNDGHNMHDNSVASGDAWIQSWVPGLLTAMAGKKAALILMFDEAYTSPPYIYMSFSGPATKLAYKSTAAYSHYSLAKLLEDVWGGGSLGQGDVNAPSPLEFFGAGGPPVPDFSMAANPGTISFIAGQSAASTVSLTASGGFTGTVGLTAVSVPVGATTACVPASISGTQTSTCTITGTNAGSYAVTIAGTSGALVHTAPVAVTITAPGPTARFVYSPSVPSVNDTITFDATSSTDSDPSATLQARWDWESDGTWDTTLSSSLTAQHAFAASGSYTVKLEIQDSHGFSDTDSRMITVFASGGGGVGAPPGYGLTNPSLLQAHGPIYIGSDAQFTAANGVRSGTGTITDPYVISNWFIDGNLYATTQAMIWIEGTSSYVVIENVRIANLAGTNQWEAFQLGHWPATIGTQHVTIRHNSVENAQHAYGIAVREGSSDVHVEANYIQLEANFDWVYGIATDRGVHAITVFGNYVNAHTSGTWHTVGIHLSDYHVTDARRATGMVAVRNTVVNAAWPGISTAAETIYDTTYSTVAITPIRLPTGFQGTVVDLGPGITKTDLTPVTFVTFPAATSATFTWSGSSLNLSATVGGLIVFDTASTAASQNLQASWTGSLANLDVTSLSAAIVSFQLQSAAAVVFDGSGFTPSTTYNVTRANSGGTSRILSAQSTPVGGLTFTIPTSTPSTYAVSPGSVSDITPPVTTYSASGSSGTSNWYTSAVTVTLTATDDSSGIQSSEYRVDGGAWRSYTSVFPVSGNGTHTIEYHATDVASNVETAKSSVVRISGSSFGPPVTLLQVTGAAGMNGWYVSLVNVTLTATSPSGTGIFTMYSVDGSGWTQYAQRFLLPEGRHTLDYQSWDTAGFVEPKASTSVDVDLTPPTLGGSPSGVQTTPDVTISWTGSDVASGIARYEVSIDGGPTQSVGTTTSLSRRWSDGDHTIRVTAYDAAGNQHATVINFRVSPASSGVFGIFQTLPLVLPAIALCLLLFAIAFWRRGLRRREDEARGYVDPDEYPEEYDASDL